MLQLYLDSLKIHSWSAVISDCSWPRRGSSTSRPIPAEVSATSCTPTVARPTSVRCRVGIHDAASRRGAGHGVVAGGGSASVRWRCTPRRLRDVKLSPSYVPTTMYSPPRGAPSARCRRARSSPSRRWLTPRLHVLGGPMCKIRTPGRCPGTEASDDDVAGGVAVTPGLGRGITCCWRQARLRSPARVPELGDGEHGSAGVPQALYMSCRTAGRPPGILDVVVRNGDRPAALAQLVGLPRSGCCRRA